MKKRNLLVTGGAGFIGCNFVHYWLKKYPRDKIVVLDALTYAGNLSNLDPVIGNPNFRFVHGDIRDQGLVESLLLDNHLNTIVHFAAESHVDRSITDPDAFIDTNIIGTHNLLKAAKNIWLDEENPVENHRFHHVSTDEVYGSLEAGEPAFTEDHQYQPNSPYSASKAASDHLVRSYHHTYGLNITTSNCSNNYGPYHFPEKLIPLIITNILLGKSLPIYGDGKNIRDWLYVEDHAKGIELVLEKGELGETYNIGGNNEWANIDIVKSICKHVDELFSSEPSLKERYPNSPSSKGLLSASLITYVPDRAGHDRRYAIDAEKISTCLGHEPEESFESGMKKTIDWYFNNREWWGKLL